MQKSMIQASTEFMPFTTQPASHTDEERAMARRMVAKLMRGEDTRPDRVATVRAALAEGKLEKPLRLEIAVDRLMAELAA